MTPVAAPLLLEALERTPVKEDQSTELTAHVLRSDPRFRARFCERIGAPLFPHADIRTQRPTASGRRVDLELILRGLRTSHAVWIEVKAGAPEHDSQVTAYRSDLSRLYPGRYTIAILAPVGDEIFAAHPWAAHMTWQQLAGLLDEVGREDSGTGWRQHASADDARVAQRTLLELNEHLQRRRRALKVMPDDPITVLDSLVLSRFHALHDKGGLIDCLLDLAVTHIEGGEGTASWRWHEETRGRVVRGLPLPEWAAELNRGGDEPYFELHFAWTDRFIRSHEPRDQPLFLASLALNNPTEQCRAALSSREGWALSPELLTAVSNRHASISKLRYVAEVATSGITLASQAERLGQWAADAFKDLAMAPRPPRQG